MISLANHALASEVCHDRNAEADASFDFTADVSRWGTETVDTTSPHKPAKLNSIKVNKLPIFDRNNPDENNAVYRWVNRHHIYTHDSVVLDQLLFEEGDVASEAQIKESERLLRDQKFTSDAKVRILRECPDGVDLEVVTREVWTLTPELSYKASGGDSAFKLGIRDSNFLGTGRRFSTAYERDEDRSAFEIRAQDKNYLGSRREIDARIANRSDGYLVEFVFGRPFYALDSRSAWRSQFRADEQISSLYAAGDKIAETSVTSEFAELSYGFSAGIQAHHVNRYTLGVRHSKKDYRQGDDLPFPTSQPDSYAVDYPFAAFEYIENNYARAFNINQIYRTEDLHIGKRFYSSLGYAPGNDSRLILDGSYRDTLISSPKVLLQLSMDWSGQLIDATNEWQDSLAHINLAYHRGQTASRSLYVGLNSTFSHQLRNGEQVTLGGNSGLRGFENHFVSGDHSTVLTIEQRLFTKAHVLNLVRLGYAAFIDIGSSFGGTDELGNPQDNTVYSNVGIGLRLAPSKSEKGQVIHIDLAYPISGDFQDKGRSLQFTAELKKSF
tara:strand:- start:4640 stop:6301 length:1662 start_codon:yes stop_codon:yes gene_type:complete